jgi:hypothetical protein
MEQVQIINRDKVLNNMRMVAYRYPGESLSKMDSGPGPPDIGRLSESLTSSDRPP